MIIPFLLLAGWVVGTALTLEYVVRHPIGPSPAGEYERGFEAAYEYYVSEYRQNVPEYDRGFTAGWCALLDTIDQQEIDPNYTVAKEWVIVRRKPKAAGL